MHQVYVSHSKPYSHLLRRSDLYQRSQSGNVPSLLCFLQAAGQGVKAAIDLVGAGVKIAQEGYEVAAPVIKQGVDVAAPFVSEAVKVTTETAAPLLSRATPVVKVSSEPAAAAAVLQEAGRRQATWGGNEQG